MRLRLLALGGVFGPVAFVTAWALAGVTTAGYSALEDAISELAAVDAPTWVVMTVGFLAFGAGVVAFGLALWAVQPGPAWIAAIATGVSTIAVAATPLSTGSSDALHGLFATIGYVTLVAVPLLSARPLARAGHVRRARVAWLVAGISAAALVLSALGPAHGFWQRAGLTTADAWIVVTALGIVRTTAPIRAAAAGRRR